MSKIKRTSWRRMLMRSTKENAFIVRSHSRILERSSTRIKPPRRIPQGRNYSGKMTSFSSAMCSNLVLRLSLLCLLNEVAMCFVSTGVQFQFASRPSVLPCSVWPSLRVWCAFLSNSGLCFLVYFICSRSQSPRLRDVNLGNSRIWLHLLI